jgi:hypothetical protein
LNQESFILHFSLFILHSLFPHPPFIGAVGAAKNHFTTSPSFVSRHQSFVRYSFGSRSIASTDSTSFRPFSALSLLYLSHTLSLTSASFLSPTQAVAAHAMSISLPNFIAAVTSQDAIQHAIF